MKLFPNTNEDCHNCQIYNILAQLYIVEEFGTKQQIKSFDKFGMWLLFCKKAFFNMDGTRVHHRLPS